MRKLNWKSIVGWAVAIAVIFGIIGYNGYQQKKKSETGRQNVYAVLPLSGVGASVGADIKKVIDLFISENKDVAFDVTYIDSELNPMKTVSALQQALLFDEKPIAITVTTAISNVTVPVITRKHGMTFPISTASLPSATKEDNFQRVSYSYENATKDVADYFAKRYSKIAVIYSDNEYGIGALNAFKKAYEKGNNRIIFEQSFSVKDLSVRTEILKVLDKNPEAIFVVGTYSAAYKNVLNGLKQYEYKGAIGTEVTLGIPGAYTDLTDPTGIIFPVPDFALNEPRTEQGKKLRAFFQKNNIPLYYLMNETVNALTAIQTMLAKEYPMNAETFANKIKDINDVHFLPDGDCLYDFVLATFKDGKIVPVEE